jgi:hypothetical protein
MNIIHKLFFRRFSEEDYKQLVEIHKKETIALKKRPQFIAGLVLWGGLIFYFWFRAFMPSGWNMPKAGDIAGIVGGSAFMATIIWLLGKYVFKTSVKTFILFFIPLMFPMQIILLQENTFNVEYFVYTIVGLFAFIFINDSIRKYFCERLLEEQKDGGADH